MIRISQDALDLEELFRADFIRILEDINALDYIQSKNGTIRDVQSLYDYCLKDWIIVYIHSVVEKVREPCRSVFCHWICSFTAQNGYDYSVTNFLASNLYSVLEIVDDYFNHECDLKMNFPKVIINKGENEVLPDIDPEQFSQDIFDHLNGEK